MSLGPVLGLPFQIANAVRSTEPASSRGDNLHAWLWGGVELT